jgi:hypothetical protein
MLRSFAQEGERAMAQGNDGQIPPARQTDLHALALHIVTELLPHDCAEARFIVNEIQELLGFIETGQWPFPQVGPYSMRQVSPPR